MQVGSIVKSLDFNGIEDCYMVGKVVGIREYDGEFRAEFIKRVWQGVEDTEFETDDFVSPLQGEHMFDRAESPRDRTYV